MLEPAMQLLYGFYQSAKIFRQGCYWKHFWNTSRVTFPGIINIVVWLGRLVSGGFRRQQGALLTGVRDIQVGAEPSQTSLCKGTKSSVIGENSLQLATFSSGTPLPPTKPHNTGVSLSAKSAQTPGSTVMTELAGQLVQTNDQFSEKAWAWVLD